ncbi:hypothetical protein PoB_006608700 [Plakobranchus ocellatus]|uniref:Uncharacterized protein n=1 Tax=Plakobranchus ocellatus TaxID=259542 RepID=A0AAV4D609_9GAST|nr:hypothetical protein PoB_006608700 [Plakobranchus ocellatus]
MLLPHVRISPIKLLNAKKEEGRDAAGVALYDWSFTRMSGGASALIEREARAGRVMASVTQWITYSP